MNDLKAEGKSIEEIRIVERMPVSIRRLTGSPVPVALIGATIVALGTVPLDGPELEGGGLVIDFIRYGGEEVERIAFEFNEAAMWVVFEGIPKSHSTLALSQ